MVMGKSEKTLLSYLTLLCLYVGYPYFAVLRGFVLLLDWMVLEWSLPAELFCLCPVNGRDERAVSQGQLEVVFCLLAALKQRPTTSAAAGKRSGKG